MSSRRSPRNPQNPQKSRDPPIRLGVGLPAGGLPLVMPKKRLEAYEDAVRKFRTTFGEVRSPIDREWLLRVVLEACRSAENYIARNADENDAFRKNDAAAMRSFPDQRKAISSLSSFARNHGRQSGHALAAAGFRGRGEKDEGKDLSVAFVDMLSDYQRALRITTRKAGPWTHRSVRGNLFFRTPIDGRKNHPTTGAGLLFHLVLYFRNFSEGVPSFSRYATGQPMPPHGRPHYDLAAAFVQVATGEEGLTEEPGRRLRKLIKENPGIGLFHWPAE
jgi:hypothetical protein